MPEFRDENIPLAYLITFRAYGTWLHGDPRGSVDRFHNRFGSPLIAPSERWKKHNLSLLKQKPVKLKSSQRALLEEVIRETCRMRKWDFWAVNVRSNHIHTVVFALCKPEKVLIALKANATRKLRETGYWRSDKSPWVEGGSTKYLWNDSDVINAVVYVEYEQGEPLR